MKKLILLLIISFSLFSCMEQHHKRHVYKTTDKPGYCYQDNGIWYIYYYNSSTNSYYYSGSANVFDLYDVVSDADWSPSTDNVSNYNSMPTEAMESAESVSEGVSGEDAGGSESGGTSGGESGSDGGGSDGGGGGDGGD